MEQLNIKTLNSGVIYEFKSKDHLCHYIGRVKTLDKERVYTSVYLKIPFRYCVKGGDFQYSLYTAYRCSDKHLESFLSLEEKSGYGPTKHSNDFKIGEIVEYIGKKNKDHVDCYYKSGEHVVIQEFDITHKRVTIRSSNSKHAPIQDVKLSQISKIKVNKELVEEPVDKKTLKLTKFPEEGWCKDAKQELGNFLANKYDLLALQPGRSGYSWGNTGYWIVIGHSTKPEYKYKDLIHFISKTFDNNFDEKEEEEEEKCDTEALQKIPERYKGGMHVQLLDNVLDNTSKNFLLKSYIGYVVRVVNDYCDGLVEIELLENSGIPIRVVVPIDCLLLTNAFLTNSLEDKKIKRSKLKNFVLGKRVKVVRDVMGASYVFGNVGVIVEVTSEFYCNVRFFTHYKDGRVCKIHKKNIEVTDYPLSKPLQNQREIKEIKELKDVKNNSLDHDVVMGEAMQVEKHQNNLRWMQNTHLNKYIKGTDPYNHKSSSKGSMIRSNTFFHFSKTKKEIRGPTIKDRIVKSQRIPDKPDKFIMDNSELIIELNPIKDRIIKIKK